MDCPNTIPEKAAAPKPRAVGGDGGARAAHSGGTERETAAVRARVGARPADPALLPRGAEAAYLRGGGEERD